MLFILYVTYRFGHLPVS